MSGGGAPAAEEGGSGTNSFGEEAQPSVDLNLTALMDILSNLLFFLLASFGATVVMAINTQVPAQSSEQSSIADTGESVTVNIKLEKTLLEVTATGSQQSASDMAALARTIPNVDGKIDGATLTEQLLGIKTKYPKSDTAILTPEPGVKYEAMVQVMDAAREHPVTAGGIAHMVALFPTVVISTIVK
jgi:biopolymer transport protein ExbD